MSEGLKKKIQEKAKTFYELGKEWMETKVVDDRNNEKWVLVSVAQQEIDKLKTFRDNAVKKWCDSQAELERERGSLKQKLQQIAVEIENLRRQNQYNYKTDKWQVPQRQLFALEKKFEELLK